MHSLSSKLFISEVVSENEMVGENKITKKHRIKIEIFRTGHFLLLRYNKIGLNPDIVNTFLTDVLAHLICLITKDILKL